MYQQKLAFLIGLSVLFASSFVIPLSVYAFSVSPSVNLDCGSDNKVLFRLWFTNNEPSDTLVVTAVNSNFSGELEVGTINPGQTQLATVGLQSQAITAGTVTFKYFKQNDSSSLQTQGVGYGSFSCPLPTSVPTATPIVLPTNTPIPTATPVPQSTNTNTQTGATSTPVPTQKLENNLSNNNKQYKPFFVQTNNNSKSDEKEQKNNENKQAHSTISASLASTEKANKPKSSGFFEKIKNIFGGFFSFLNPFKGPHSKN